MQKDAPIESGRAEKNTEMANLIAEKAPLVPKIVSNDVRTKHDEYVVDF